MERLNASHDPALKSWVESANVPDSDFPVQNLPYGVFSANGSGVRRPGVAIGDRILDLGGVEAAGLLPTPRPVFDGASLNAFMSLGPETWCATRKAISELLSAAGSRLLDHADLRERALVAQSDATLHLPIDIRGFTDFYSSREHATNVGTMFRDAENPLMPNWLYMPIGYNGRASGVVASGTAVHRPWGQARAPGATAPRFGPCRKLDIELEMGVVVGASSDRGAPISIAEADSMIFGYVLLNDWSARDFQVWEYQPLGPFQSKAFATTISPWVVTQEALEPFRVPGPVQDPEPLPYLRQAGAYNFDIRLTASLQPQTTHVPTTFCRTNFRHMYWSSAQQLAHHAIGGCGMQTGDLLGSGTISGSARDSVGSLLERTWNGTEPLALEGGGNRTFVEDGDTLTLSGWSEGEGFRVGFGEATGTILPPVDFDATRG